MYRLLVRTLTLEGHHQGVDDQVGVGRDPHGPADDASAVEVDDAGKVEPPLTGPELGHVSRPELVGRRWREVPLDQIRCRGHIGATGPPPTASVRSDQALLGHQPGDSLLGAALVEAAQLGVGPWGAIGGARATMDFADQLAQLGISLGMLRQCSTTPGVIARARDLEHPAQPLDPVVGSELGDEAKAAHRIVSLAK
jgi:hypothetical protein